MWPHKEGSCRASAYVHMYPIQCVYIYTNCMCSSKTSPDVDDSVFLACLFLINSFGYMNAMFSRSYMSTIELNISKC